MPEQDIGRRTLLQSPAALGYVAAAGTAAAQAGQTAAEGGPTMATRFTVNGRAVSLDLDPRTTLLDALREHLHLTGTKKGCVLMDAAMQTSQVIAQRFVFSVPAEVRGRANAIFVTVQFAGGAVGSMMATVLWHAGGWPATALAGAAAGFAALLLCILERRRGKGPFVSG